MKTQVKTLLLLSVCLLVTNTLSAQEYEQNPAIDKFVGTWEWTSGSDKFQIVLTKQKLLLTTMRRGKTVAYYNDVAVGWHSYTQADKLIESSMNMINLKNSTWKEASQNSTMMDNNTESNSINFFFKDITKKKKGRARLTIPAGKTNELTWELEEENWNRIIFEGRPAPIFIEGFSVPTNLILKKVK